MTKILFCVVNIGANFQMSIIEIGINASVTAKNNDRLNGSANSWCDT